MTATYLALDLETTGLDPQADRILEIAAVVLDEHLEEVSDWFVARIGCPHDVLADMPQVVKDMHTKTGLVACVNGVWRVVDGLERLGVMNDFEDLITRYGSAEQKLELLGCGVHFDRSFLNLELTKATIKTLSHRTFDSRSITSIATKDLEYVFGERTAGQVEHTARGDVERSIAKLKLARSIFRFGVDSVEGTRHQTWTKPVPTSYPFVESTQLPPIGEPNDLDRAYFGIEDESVLHSDRPAGLNAPSDDTADAYAEAVEAGAPSTPVALADLLEATRSHVMTDEEREAQRQSWVRGEMAIGLDEQEAKARAAALAAAPEPASKPAKRKGSKPAK